MAFRSAGEMVKAISSFAFLTANRISKAGSKSTNSDMEIHVLVSWLQRAAPQIDHEARTEFQELTEYAQEIMEAYTSAAPDGKIKLYAVADQLAGISDRLDAIAHIV